MSCVSVSMYPRKQTDAYRTWCMRHVSYHNLRVGSENRRKNAKGFPEVGAPPICKAPARYKNMRAGVISKVK